MRLKFRVNEAIDYLNKHQNIWRYSYSRRVAPMWSEEGSQAHERRRKRDGMMDYPSGHEVIKHAVQLRNRRIKAGKELGQIEPVPKRDTE